MNLKALPVKIQWSKNRQVEHIVPTSPPSPPPRQIGLGQFKKIQKSFHWALQEKKILPGITNKEFQCIFFNCPRIAKKTETLLSDSVVIFYVLYNNLFYNRVGFAFDLQKDLYYIHDYWGFFSFSSSVKYWHLS